MDPIIRQERTGFKKKKKKVECLIRKVKPSYSFLGKFLMLVPGLIDAYDKGVHQILYILTP